MHGPCAVTAVTRLSSRFSGTGALDAPAKFGTPWLFRSADAPSGQGGTIVPKLGGYYIFFDTIIARKDG